MNDVLTRPTLALLATATLGLVTCNGAAQPPNGNIDSSTGTPAAGYWNVRSAPYYAAGDGTTDDTAAFQQALNDANAAGGGVVFAPAGQYRIATHLTVPANTSLMGVYRAPPTYWSGTAGTTLLAYEGAGSATGTPFVTLAGPNSTIEGMAIFYPQQTNTNPPVAYPWTIADGGSGPNVAILDMLLVNPYDGIALTSGQSGRHLIQRVHGQPLNTGIFIDNCYDIGRIQDIHFVPEWAWSGGSAPVLQYLSANAVSFKLGRADWEVMQDIFSYHYHAGVQLIQSTNGAMNGQMSNVNLDDVDIGLDVYKTQQYAVHVSNLNVANAGDGTTRVAIYNHGGTDSYLNVTNASFWGNLQQAVVWQGTGYLSIFDSRFLAWSSSLPAIQITNGRAVIEGNYFQDVIGTAISASTNNRVLIVGNELVGNAMSLTGPAVMTSGNQL